MSIMKTSDVDALGPRGGVEEGPDERKGGREEGQTGSSAVVCHRDDFFFTNFPIPRVDCHSWMSSWMSLWMSS